MTRDEILAMEPGREMDALVSVEIMKRDTCAIHRIGPGEWCRKCNSYAPERHSTDIAAAWQVVEKFRRGFGGRAACCIEIRIYDALVAADTEAVIWGPNTAKVSALGEEAPEAICKASLLAKLEAS